MKSILKRTWAEVDLDVIRNNYLAIRERMSGNARLCCVIKANAYGHGALPLARLYESLRADMLAVSNIEEGIQLRLGGIKLPILLLGYTPCECAHLLAEYSLTQTVFSYEYAVALGREAERLGLVLPVHIKLDTGMGRIGFRCVNENEIVNAVEEIEEVTRISALACEGIFTHFAISDGGERGHAYTLLQCEIFQGVVEKLKGKGIDFKIKHCSNSAAILDYPQLAFDIVRAGVVLYGISPSADVQNTKGFSQAMSLRSVVSFVKDIDEGAFVSYGCTFRADRKMRVATVPCGYADGYLRNNGNGNMYVLVRGQRARTVGRVCMDQLMIDVTDIEEVNVGDTVTLMGTDGDECITAQMIADRNGTIPYEIVCQVGMRVPRVYLKNGEVCSVVDNILPEI